MKQFWEIDEEGYYTLEKINEKKIAKAEKKLGVILPDTYKKLILEQNGGYIVHNAFPTSHPNSWAEDHIQFNHLLGIAKDEGIMDSEYLIEEWELPKGLVLINGDGHTWVAMDYRKTKENPPIHYFDVETEEDFKLADSFDEFIEGLYTVEYTADEEDETEYEYEYEEEEYITKAELEAILEKEAPDPADIHQITKYPLQDLEEVEWFFKRIKSYIESVKDEDVLYEVAASIDTILMLRVDTMPSNDIIKKTLFEIVDIFEKTEVPQITVTAGNFAINIDALN
ncbi:SMI1/KNR4 family protein [Bacillus pumilus]|uniref:SMI1/KNR4 family protein n=1 Tax=Bacillus pumilus TaxID=1408 RepID=UPI00017A5DA8|nr:SMI1/KNR4 family protein [Bacillus pumilus]EDW22746.1 SMI1 / KNR4 family [Bacillus pumilus ATCC 7061]MBB6600693.1 SMI1/KNR4 family protein [Bacillus pumilus]MCR4352060.1 SMI1/KNR4 family protein [Bacillus pumilus]MCY7506404.1 SMI1/KNR4 family protein [Bacillus pumilus]MDR4269221.1 SMI1/KNR4 family protein [Bacillus pumilus]